MKNIIMVILAVLGISVLNKTTPKRKYPEKCPECGAGWLSKRIPWQHQKTCSRYPSKDL